MNRASTILIALFILASPLAHAEGYTSGWADRHASESGQWWFQLIGYNPYWADEMESVEYVGENIPATEPFVFANPLGRYSIHFDERLSPTDMGDGSGVHAVSVPAGETVVIPPSSTGYYCVYTDFADGSTSWIEDRDWACLDIDCTIYGWGPPDDAAAYDLHEMALFTVNTSPGLPNCVSSSP